MTEYYVDPDYVSVIENFDQLTHTDIHTAVDALNPAVLTEGGRLFNVAGIEFGDAVARAHGEIRAAIADGWRGAAAQQAAATVTALEQAGLQITQVLGDVGQRLVQAGDAAEAVRAAVPAPSGTEPDHGAALLDPSRADANAAATKAAENARLDSVQAMDTIYAPTLLTTGSGVPAFVGLTGVPQAGMPSGAEIVVATANSDAPEPGTPAPDSPGLGGTTAGTPEPGTSAPGGPTDGTQAAGTTNSERLLGSTGAQTTPGTGTEPAARQPVPSVPAAGAAPASGAVPAAVTAPRVAPNAGGVLASAPGVPSRAGRTRAASSDERRDQTGSAGGDTTSGLAAGAMGGMLGGALAVSDSTRPTGTRPKTEDTVDEDDNFLHFSEEDLTYLEPADEENPLIGPLDPTTPAVVGEWTGRE